MGKRLNIGIYISPADVDIAAWFNMLKRSHHSYTRWVKALLAAYALNDTLRIGAIDRKATLIKGENGQPVRNTVDIKGSFRYGWQIRGPGGEYVIGSVINVTIPKQDLQPVLEESWVNGHKLSTFIKSLIRQNLRTADRDIPPKLDEYSRVWSNYLVKINGTNMSPGQPAEHQPAGWAQAEADTSWITEADRGEASAAKPESSPGHTKSVSTPAPVPKPVKLQDPDRAFSFADDEPEENPAEGQSSSMGLNPLVGLI